MRDFNQPVLMRQVHLEVIPNTDVISQMLTVQVIKPVLADKFPVRHDGIYGFSTEQSDKAFHQGNAFFTVGVASLGQHHKQQRDGDTLIDNTSY